MLKVSRKTVAGEQRGKKIGFPTLNFPLKKTDKIKRGVWFVKLKNGKKTLFAVANVGKAKTFDGKEEKIEVHLFAEIYPRTRRPRIYPWMPGGLRCGISLPAPAGKKYRNREDTIRWRAELHFLKYLRKTKKFKTIEELKNQIKNDIKKAKLLFMSFKK